MEEKKENQPKTDQEIIDEMKLEYDRFQVKYEEPYSLGRLARKLINLNADLIKNTTDENLKATAIIAQEDLLHTEGKEVKYAEGSYRQTLKKKAAKKRSTEYEDEYQGALSQIHNDVILILKHFDKE